MYSGVFRFAVGCSFQRSACCCCDMGAAASGDAKATTDGHSKIVGEVPRTSSATTYAVQVDAAGKDGATMRNVHPPEKLTDAELQQRYENTLATVAAATTPAQLASACNAVPYHVLNRLSPAQIRRAIDVIVRALATVDPGEDDASVTALRLVANAGGKHAVKLLLETLAHVRRGAGYSAARDAVMFLRTRMAVALEGMKEGGGGGGAGGGAGGGGGGKPSSNRYKRGVAAAEVLTHTALLIKGGAKLAELTKGALLDQHGNVQGNTFDLGRDKAFKGQVVVWLVGTGELEGSTQGPTPVLEVLQQKGFGVTKCVHVACLSQLQDDVHCMQARRL